MKFCPRKKYEYKGLNSSITTVDYITLDDIIKFHGQEFANKWLEFIEYKSKTNIHGQECWFYADYEFAARQTDSFLHPIN